jgi:hypothetical protein
MIQIRSRRVSGALIALAAGAVVAALALLPGSWGVAHGQTAGPPATPTAAPTPVSTTVPPTGGTVSHPAAKVTLTLPALGEPLVVVVQPVVPLSSDPTAAQLAAQRTLQAMNVPPPANTDGSDAVISEVFQLDATNQSTGQTVTTFDQPVTVGIDVSPETLALAGGDLANVSLQFFDTATGTWQPVSCTSSGSGLACEISHFSLWAVVVTSSPIAGAAPVTGWFVAAAVAAAGAVAAGGVALRRRRA